MCTQKQYFCIAILFSSTKLVIKVEQDLPGTEGRRGKRVGEEARGEKLPK
jgi:hypothetical protein